MRKIILYVILSGALLLLLSGCATSVGVYSPAPVYYVPSPPVYYVSPPVYYVGPPHVWHGGHYRHIR